MAQVQVAILDDYQNVAMEMADWTALARSSRVRVTTGPIVVGFGGFIVGEEIDLWATVQVQRGGADLRSAGSGLLRKPVLS